MAPADVLGGSKPGQVRHISESKSRAIAGDRRKAALATSEAPPAKSDHRAECAMPPVTVAGA